MITDFSRWRHVQMRYDGPVPARPVCPPDHNDGETGQCRNRRKLAWGTVRQYGIGSLGAARACRKAPTERNRRAHAGRRRHLKSALTSWAYFRDMERAPPGSCRERQADFVFVPIRIGRPENDRHIVPIGSRRHNAFAFKISEQISR